MTEAMWPGCTALPRFEQYVGRAATELGKDWLGMEWLSNALGGNALGKQSPLVQRPLATSDSGFRFLQRLLVWKPRARTMAAELTGDPFFDSEDWLDPACENALALTSRQDLVHWVRCALRMGRPLTMDLLKASAPIVGAAAAPRSGAACGAETAVPTPEVAGAPEPPETPKPPEPPRPPQSEPRPSACPWSTGAPFVRRSAPNRPNLAAMSWPARSRRRGPTSPRCRRKGHL